MKTKDHGKDNTIFYWKDRDRKLKKNILLAFLSNGNSYRVSPEVENGKMTELVHNTSSNLDLYLTGFVFSTYLHIFIDELVPVLLVHLLHGSSMLLLT